MGKWYKTSPTLHVQCHLLMQWHHESMTYRCMQRIILMTQSAAMDIVCVLSVTLDFVTSPFAAVAQGRQIMQQSSASALAVKDSQDKIQVSYI